MNIQILKIALAEIGFRGITGPKTNKQILKYFSELGIAWVKDDDTAWCSAFVNWVLMKAKIKGTGLLNARSFLNWGKKTDTPQMGDIVVLWRESIKSWKGHCGFYICDRGDTIMILGGNQDNSVSIKAYDKKMVLAYLTEK
jgi:uncharacterized protein (TIGR02594 family)